MSDRGFQLEDGSVYRPPLIGGWIVKGQTISFAFKLAKATISGEHITQTGRYWFKFIDENTGVLMRPDGKRLKFRRPKAKKG